jgi:hypothetical protein
MDTSPAWTLQDVFLAVDEYASSDEEVVATLLHLLGSGRVRWADTGCGHALW